MHTLNSLYILIFLYLWGHSQAQLVTHPLTLMQTTPTDSLTLNYSHLNFKTLP